MRELNLEEMELTAGGWGPIIIEMEPIEPIGSDQ